MTLISENLRMLGLACLIVLGLAVEAHAQEAGSDAAIELTIQSQINAFEADDFGKAFGFASPNIQSLFGSPERFGSMVKNGYPMVWRPADVQYLELREVNGALWKKVLIRDQSGELHLLDYQMVPGPDGWRINGVQLLKRPDVGA